jgi:hypothetical protein
VAEGAVRAGYGPVVGDCKVSQGLSGMGWGEGGGIGVENLLSGTPIER